MDFLDPQRLLTGELDDRALRGLVRFGLGRLLAERDGEDVQARDARWSALVRQLDSAPVPDRTIVDVARRRAEAPANDRAYAFLRDGERDDEERLSYAELDRRARAIAARLQAEGSRGERALLCYKNRFAQQFWKAKIDPNELYVASRPGVQYRLKAWDSGYDNLALAGDWIYTGMNIGSIDCAVVGGALAAHALTGSPSIDEIPGYTFLHRGLTGVGVPLMKR